MGRVNANCGIVWYNEIKQEIGGIHMDRYEVWNQCIVDAEKEIREKLNALDVLRRTMYLNRDARYVPVIEEKIEDIKKSVKGFYKDFKASGKE